VCKEERGKGGGGGVGGGGGGGRGGGGGGDSGRGGEGEGKEEEDEEEKKKKRKQMKSCPCAFKCRVIKTYRAVVLLEPHILKLGMTKRRVVNFTPQPTFEEHIPGALF
jgi:hypothetical protein